MTINNVDDRETPPPAPAALFAWAAAWAGVSVLGWVVFGMNLVRLAEADFSGQRTFGIVAFTPTIALVVAILCAVRAFRAIGPARAYRAQWSVLERKQAEQAHLAGQPSTPLIVFALAVAAIWVAGVTAVLVYLPALSSNVDGFSLAIMLLALVAMLWISVLRAGVRRRGVPTRSASPR